MAVIKINKLGGIYPSISPRNLADNAAQTAKNLQANTPEFRPFATDLVVATLTDNNPKSLYRLARRADGTLITSPSEGWRSHPAGVTVAKGQLNDDRTERTYYAFDDGSAPPRVFNNQGDDRRLGVPQPLVKPDVQAVEVYTFTRDLKLTEIQMAIQSVVQLTKANAAPALVGIGTSFEAPGWLKESDFSLAPDAGNHIVRVFALNPTTNQIISTYSNMPVGEAAWIFNPALGGDFATKPPGFVLPSWANGHTKWWRIRLRAFANAYDVNEPGLAAALQTIDMPGTQGAKKYLTPAQSFQLSSDITLQFDKDVGRVATLVNVLNASQAQAAAVFNQGGALGLVGAVTAFYARSDIAASIDSATNAFAENIWRYAVSIGEATAAPFYRDQGGSS